MWGAPSIKILFVAAVGGLMFLPAESTAQGWSWPENPENLKVLGDTVSVATLSSTMRGFTSALGVRCQHCHVGEAGIPLSEFDFPSDDKRTKRVARDMFRMMQMINNDVIANIEDPSGAKVTCFTCHKGQSTPPPPMHIHLAEVISEDGIDAGMTRYTELHDEFFGMGVYDFGPRTFTRVADALLEDDMHDEALTILARGAKDHPDDSLIQFYTSQAYLAKEDSTLARIYLEKAVTLNPGAGFLRGKLRAVAAH